MNRFRKNKNQKGFTMIELMVVVVIVGILAAIAIPIYGRYIKNARMTEASSHVAELITAAKAVAQENDSDGDGIGNWPNAATHGVFDASVRTENFTYSAGVYGANGDAEFVITATGDALGAHDMTGAIFEITVPNLNATGAVTQNVLRIRPRNAALARRDAAVT